MFSREIFAYVVVLGLIGSAVAEFTNITFTPCTAPEDQPHCHIDFLQINGCKDVRNGANCIFHGEGHITIRFNYTLDVDLPEPATDYSSKSGHVIWSYWEKSCSFTSCPITKGSKNHYEQYFSIEGVEPFNNNTVQFLMAPKPIFDMKSYSKFPKHGCCFEFKMSMPKKEDD